MTDPDKLAALIEALAKIVDGDVPRHVAVPWRSDGVASKHDKCPHGVFMWEDCAGCVSDFAAAALRAMQEVPHA